MHKIPPTTGFILTLQRVPWKGDKRWMDSEGTRLYTWDEYHGEFEVFTRQGYHLGAVDLAGVLIKSAKKGRTIDV
jgi:hypothetical protein